MAPPFPVHLPLETAYVRRVLFAAEVLDAVTLEPITQGLTVSATGLSRAPIVNWGGHYVWLEEGASAAIEVHVDPGHLPYLPATVPAPVLPTRQVTIELPPALDYPFGVGVTGCKGTLLESLTGPRHPVTDADVWLRWIDDTAAGTTWVDATTRSRTNASGDFAAILRLSRTGIPRLDASGKVRIRVRAQRAGTTLTSAEITLSQGRVADALPPFAWDAFLP